MCLHRTQLSWNSLDLTIELSLIGRACDGKRVKTYVFTETTPIDVQIDKDSQGRWRRACCIHSFLFFCLCSLLRGKLSSVFYCMSMNATVRMLESVWDCLSGASKWTKHINDRCSHHPCLAPLPTIAFPSVCPCLCSIICTSSHLHTFDPGSYVNT